MMTIDGKPLFDGAELFALKDTHGFPLDFALDKIINQSGMAVDWPAFIEAARRNGWWDFQTLDVMQAGFLDAGLPRGMGVDIEIRFKRYVLRYPHPKMIALGLEEEGRR